MDLTPPHGSLVEEDGQRFWFGGEVPVEFVQGTPRGCCLLLGTSASLLVTGALLVVTRS